MVLYFELKQFSSVSTHVIIMGQKKSTIIMRSNIVVKVSMACDPTTSQDIFITFWIESWPSSDFFPGEGKIFQGGHTISLKMPKNIQFSFYKVKKHTILSGQGGGGKCPLLPSPADAHGLN